MSRFRHLIALVALALVLPSGAAAAAPQIYVGSNTARTVVFKVEAGAVAGLSVSVLGLDAALYCSETEPSHDFGPGTISVFDRATRMAEGADGLEAPLGGGGGSSSKVEAIYDGFKLTGTFAFDSSEESFHCQTTGYYPAGPKVPFEAVRYEALDGGATLPSTPGETPVYYGSEAGTEVLIEPNPKSVVVRGSGSAKCPVAGRRPTTTTVPLFGDVIDADREGESFLHTIHRHGLTDGRVWTETRRVSGVLGEVEIAGFYRRSTTVHPVKGPPRRCTTGALPFRAARYLPAAAALN